MAFSCQCLQGCLYLLHTLPRINIYLTMFCVAVLSASGGIKVDHPNLSNGTPLSFFYVLIISSSVLLEHREAAVFYQILTCFSCSSPQNIVLCFWFADVVVLVAVIILVGLFSLQHYGTDKVGWLFAPIVLLWFLMIGGIGIFNIWKYDSSVLKAFSPVYLYHYLKNGGKDGWTSLGGIMLSITGKETKSSLYILNHLRLKILVMFWHFLK